MEVSIRAYREGDETGINDAFNRAFGTGRTLEEWRWKFPSAPEGRWIMLAEEAPGRVVAQYAAVPVRFQVGEHTVRAGQVVDAFSLQRRGLTRKGVFARTVERFFADFGHPEGLSFLFGFPGRRHLGLGRALLGYGEPAPVAFWRRRAVLAGRRRWLWARYRVRLELDPAGLDRLWRRAAGRYPVAAIRDAGWIHRRFRRRPQVDYLHLAAYRAGVLEAYAVLRLTKEGLAFSELLWDGADPRALEALDEEAVLAARRVGLPELTLWLAGDPEAAGVLARRGWVREPEPRGLHLTVRSFDPRVDAAEVTRRAYLTLGDSDLV